MQSKLLLFLFATSFVLLTAEPIPDSDTVANDESRSTEIKPMAYDYDYDYECDCGYSLGKSRANNHRRSNRHYINGNNWNHGDCGGNCHLHNGGNHNGNHYHQIHHQNWHHIHHGNHHPIHHHNWQSHHGHHHENQHGNWHQIHDGHNHQIHYGNHLDGWTQHGNWHNRNGYQRQMPQNDQRLQNKPIVAVPFIEDSSIQLPTADRPSAMDANQSTVTTESSELTTTAIQTKSNGKTKNPSLFDTLKTSYAEELAKESKDSKSTGALPNSLPETPSKPTPEKAIPVKVAAA